MTQPKDERDNDKIIDHELEKLNALNNALKESKEKQKEEKGKKK